MTAPDGPVPAGVDTAVAVAVAVVAVAVPAAVVVPAGVDTAAVVVAVAVLVVADCAAPCGTARHSDNNTAMPVEAADRKRAFIPFVSSFWFLRSNPRCFF